MKKRFSIVAFLCAVLAASALPPPLEAPLPPDFNPRPDLLDANQRRGVMLELNRLKNEVQAVRAEVYKDPAFDPIKAQIAIAKTNNVPGAALELEKLTDELQAMVMVLLRESDGIAEKQVRIMQLGRMLERDLPLFRNLERQGKGAVNRFFKEAEANTPPAPADESGKDDKPEKEEVREE